VDGKFRFLLQRNIALDFSCIRYGLRNDDDAIPILLAAFYPHFPVNSNDNRYVRNRILEEFLSS